jgi:hypothetical protein
MSIIKVTISHCITHSTFQKFQISFIWIEENSYYISTRMLQGVHTIIQRKQNYKGHEGHKRSNDSAPSTSFSFVEDFMAQQRRIILLKFFSARSLQLIPLVRQPKECRLHLHRHYYHFTSDRIHRRHYYHLAPHRMHLHRRW